MTNDNEEATDFHYSGFNREAGADGNTDELGRPVEETTVNRTPWNIVSETFLPFDSAFGDGLSIVAQASNGEDTTEQSMSFIRGRDNDFNQVVLNGVETDEALRARLRFALIEDMNRPNTARLIDHRFA